ncbi:MAG: hypothetical protein AUJ49_13405 [Desulfovibrionaceae bacterium CG1_02_65_16]|nr:MAG: hypothetical protein AUJ49_13405 [Desulfovibrionaceae bacterium CG1_02_65_16]
MQRALLMLQHIADSSRGASLSELTESLGLPKTSAFDILHTMETLHFLRKDGNAYFIGAKAKEVGDAYGKMQDICSIASGILISASERFNTSVSLVQYVDKQLDYCFQHHPDDAVMVARYSSPYNILHAAASGKVLLAFMPEKEREQALDGIVLYKFTDRTLGTVEALRGELERVRAQGYALDNREYHYLLQCVAAPVLHQGEVIAAISFSGLNLYLNDPQEMIAHVLETARLVAEGMTSHLG